MDAETLVPMAQKGDDRAFYKLISDNKIKLYKIAYSYLKNEQDSLEAVQEVTFRAYTKIEKLKQPGYFNTWLIKIMINYCIDELKRQKRYAPMIEEVHGEELIDNSKLDIEMAIDRLEPKYKQIIILKYFEDLTISDISLVLDCPQGTVKTWLNKALGDLRKMLGKEGEMDVR